MKKISVLISVFLLYFNTLYCQSIVWSENFSNNPTSTGWLNIGFRGTNFTAIPDTVGVWEYRAMNTTPAANQGPRGAYKGTANAIQSSTRANGFMIFDSDWLDNNGVAGAFGQGRFPSPHRGMLISPMLDLTSFSGLNLNFSQYYRRFGGPNSNQLYPATFILFSKNGGITWSDTLTINSQVGVNTSIPSSNVIASYNAGGSGRLTQDVSHFIGGHDSVKIAFLFYGDYYFWMIDDITLTDKGVHLFIPSNSCLGDTIDIAIFNPSLNGVSNCELRLNYNPDSLHFIGSNLLNPSYNGLVVSGGNGSVSMLWYSNTNQNIVASRLLNLRFLVNGNSNLSWDTINQPCNFSDLNFNIIPSVFTSGSFNHNSKKISWFRSICEGQSFSLNGQSYTTSGTYQGRLTGTGGACDTLLTLNLNVIPRQTILPAVTRCSNQPYLFNGLSLTSSGTYYDTLTNSLGCDSILQLNLTVNPSFNQNQSRVVCSGTSFAFGGQNLTTSGNYSHTYTTVNGCDSLVNLTLNFTGSGNQVTIQASSSANGFCPGIGIRIGLPNPIPNAFYRWKLNGNILAGASSDTFYATQSGDYQMEIEVSPTCTILSNILTIAALNCNRIRGDLRYDNTNQTPLAGVPVHLKTLLGNIVASDTTDSAGVYDMAGYANGNYLLDADINYPPGGITSADALLTSRAYAGIVFLTSSRYKAADVSGNGSVNNGDALLINRKLTGLLSNFVVGPFTNNRQSFTAVGNPNLINLTILSSGDVNGNYIPTPQIISFSIDSAYLISNMLFVQVNFANIGVGVFDKGICWGYSPFPNVSTNSLSFGAGGFSFSSTIPLNNVSIVRHLRAYARTASGIYYSPNFSLVSIPGVRCPNMPTVTDIDGNTYYTVQIGSQCWLQSNLKTTKLNDGTSLSFAESNLDWRNISGKAYAIMDNNPINDDIYGKLYNIRAVFGQPRNLCPVGWHVPTDIDWQVLFNSLGGTNLVGGPLKSTIVSPSIGGWSLPNLGATNSSGFTGLAGGMRWDNGNFDRLGSQGQFWSGDWGGSFGTCKILDKDFTSIWTSSFGFGPYPNSSANSVRCIKD